MALQMIKGKLPQKYPKTELWFLCMTHCLIVLCCRSVWSFDQIDLIHCSTYRGDQKIAISYVTREII